MHAIKNTVPISQNLHFKTYYGTIKQQLETIFSTSDEILFRKWMFIVCNALRI